MLFCAHTEEKITPTKAFFMFLQFQKIFPYNVVGLQRTLPNEGYFQDRLNYLKPKYVEIVQNATERQPRAEFLMLGRTSQKQTKR